MERTEYKVAEVEELSEDGSRVIVDVEGREVAVFNLDGEYYALLNYCVHAAGPLCDGPLAGRYTTDRETGRMIYDDESRYITCPWHDWKYDIRTGKNINSDRYSVPTFETSVRDGSVYVEI